ncbi:alpha/beta hydrolase [Lactobacillus sp.] [Lactiplantibacillus mudanjiangensis]|uniref:alpha/beta hydrolase n=1 Tax=Lactiplantibacillus mudanjiangensis TaxID=1296538 RepID=UPI0010156647|nr:alpha/beta hydrolase [Lactiplantibacillus mudanjiangensis]VDG32152.1 alpha/beta hydrolase [Lactobacillus sp.] [Lactiplantibacillus mudanjiangensis]
MRKRKKWGLVALAIVIILGIGIAGGSFYLYHFAFEPTPKVLNHSSHKSKSTLATNQKWLKTVKKQTWHETSATDHLKLVADFVPAAKKTNRTIVVAHGYMGNKEQMASYIRLWHRQGYNVLAPDDRGNGKSQGHYYGFGWPDRLDYVKWTKQVIQREGTKSRIGLFGVSMGGATVMMMSGEKLPSQVKAIIEDCGYTSVGDELSYELKELYHLPKFPLIYTASWVAQAKAHFNFLTASSVTQLHHNKLPIFFIHGSKDTFVPTKMVYQNYRATTVKDKQLWVVPGAGHAESYPQHPKLYTKKVTTFMARYLK